MGLPVPDWKPLLLTESFLDQNPQCWIQTESGSVRPDPGLCFASQWLGQDSESVFEILPGNYFQAVSNRQDFWTAWLIDVCAKHSDHRQALFLRQPDRRLQAVFIDHGHLLGGPSAAQHRHFAASRYLDTRIYPQMTPDLLVSLENLPRTLDADTLWQRVQAFPDEWKTDQGLDSFAACLGRLSRRQLVQNIFGTLIESIGQTIRDDRTNFSPGRFPVRSVLPAEIRAARFA